MGDSHGGELRTGQGTATIAEAFEASVVLDLPEDGLRLDGAHAPVIQAPLACQQFLRMVSILPASDIYIYGSVALAFEAQPMKRTTFAVLSSI